MRERYVIGIDLGGTKICGAIANRQGNMIVKHTVPTKAEEGEQAVLHRILDVIEKIVGESGLDKEDIEGIGIGSPGPLDAKGGIILTTPNLPFRNFNLVKPVMERFGIPTWLDNDANVAAIGEYMFGAGKGTENMVFVTVSTGIGGGAILNGRIYRGSTSNALEVGHTTLKKDGPRCNCGNYGCAEALASGTAIARAAREALEKGEESTLSSYDSISALEVFKEAEKGDAVSQKVLHEALEYLGICISNVISTFDPEMVIIGGGVSKGGKIVFDTVNEVVRKRCFESMWKNTRIVPAALGTDAGVAGAAALAIMESEKNS